MASYPYIWNYLPLALQILAAGGLFAALFGNSLLGWYTSLFR